MEHDIETANGEGWTQLASMKPHVPITVSFS